MSKVILNFNHPYNPKIERPEDFETSLFRSAYKKIHESIKKIIARCKDVEKEKEQSELSSFDYIYNIIPIIGQRGSGKTTVMLSTLNWLKNISRVSESNFELQDTNFIVLQAIEAGHLEDNENLFGVVLARMLSYYNNLNDRYNDEDDLFNKPVLYRKFTEIYNALLSVNSGAFGSDSKGKSALKVLSELDASQNLRDSFKSLVRSFKEGVNHLQNLAGDTFIVVPIDDIDMNIKNTHKILEQIQTYMMIPGVIIVLTANYDNLMCNCENYYTDHFKEVIHASAAIEGFLGEKFIDSCVELSQEYLNKLFPAGKMVHLHHDRKHDVDVEFDNKLSGLFRSNPKSEMYSKIIVCKIAQSTEIYFYGGYKKKSFIEPDSIRSMGQFITKIMSMKIPYGIYIGTELYDKRKSHEDKSDEQIKQKTIDDIKENIKILLDDIRVRYTGSLSEAQRRRISKLADVRIENLCTVVALAAEDILKSTGGTVCLCSGHNLGSERRNEFDNLYSLKMEDIFPVIDEVNQLSSERYDGFCEAVLALFSIKMRMEQLSSDEIDMEIIEKYIGKSLFGELNNKFIGQLSFNVNDASGISEDDDKKLAKNIGYRRNIDFNKISSLVRQGIITDGRVNKQKLHVLSLIMLFLSSHNYKISVTNKESGKGAILSLGNTPSSDTQDDKNEGDNSVGSDLKQSSDSEVHSEIGLEIIFDDSVDFGLPYMFVNLYKGKKEKSIVEGEKSIVEDEKSIVEKFYSNVNEAIESWNEAHQDNVIEVLKDIGGYKGDCNIIFSDKLPIPILDIELIYNVMQNIRAKGCNAPSADAWSICTWYFSAVGKELEELDKVYDDVIGMEKDNFTNNYKKRVPSADGCGVGYMNLTSEEIDIFNDLITGLLA